MSDLPSAFDVQDAEHVRFYGNMLSRRTFCALARELQWIYESELEL